MHPAVCSSRVARASSAPDSAATRGGCGARDVGAGTRSLRARARRKSPRRCGVTNERSKPTGCCPSRSRSVHLRDRTHLRAPRSSTTSTCSGPNCGRRSPSARRRRKARATAGDQEASAHRDLGDGALQPGRGAPVRWRAGRRIAADARIEKALPLEALTSVQACVSEFALRRSGGGIRRSSLSRRGFLR